MDSSFHQNLTQNITHKPFINSKNEHNLENKSLDQLKEMLTIQNKLIANKY